MSAGVKPAFAARPGVILDQAAAELFERTFREGMDLIAEVSAYLDGIGRLESRRLSREAAADYAAESMRLTTRLMQVASWLMVQRSVREGETRPEAAAEARYRLGHPNAPRLSPRIPETLAAFSRRADRLFERVSRMDRQMYVEVELAANPVASHLERLRSAFAR